MEYEKVQDQNSLHDRIGGFHRRSKRNLVSGYSCDIADGNRLLGGIVENVSSHGFKMKQIDQAFIGDGHYYRTVLSGNGKHFKIIAKPCWRRQGADGLEIGFKIIDAPWDWAEMILEFEQENKHWAAGNS